MGKQQKVKQADTGLNHVLKARRDKPVGPQMARKDFFQIVKYDVTTHSMDIKDNYKQWERKGAAIAGRVMFERVMGKIFFCSVQDLKGSIQVYVAGDSVGEELYKDFKKMNIGGIMGVKEKAFTTKAGKVSIHAVKVTLLSKSFQVLPEKFRSLTDMDMCHRQRCVDLIMNAEAKDTFIKRFRILAIIRRYLGGEGFMEAEAPVLVSNAGGTAARPLETYFDTLDEDFKLRIPLELYLKKLIVGGLERIYETGRVFRNEGLDTRHNSEFTLVGLYQAYTSHNGMMDLIEELYRFVAQEVLGTTTITYEGAEVDLSESFACITMVDAVRKYAKMDFDQIHTLEETRAIAKEEGVEFEGRHRKGDILNLFFGEFAEEHLVQPAFVLDYPVEISPLTKKKPGNPDYVECFELFMNGWEMTNACPEISDSIDRRKRFRAQEELLVQGDGETSHTDEGLLSVLEMGIPPTGGIGSGIDRMIMLLTNLPAIRDVLLFPTVKSLSDNKQESPSVYAGFGTF